MPPMWAMLLAMTNGEVDRAMWLEQNLTAEWFERWKVYNNELQKWRNKEA